MVAPNSPRLRAKASSAPTSSPGRDIGRVIVQKVRHLEYEHRHALRGVGEDAKHFDTEEKEAHEAKLKRDREERKRQQKLDRQVQAHFGDYDSNADVAGPSAYCDVRL